MKRVVDRLLALAAWALIARLAWQSRPSAQRRELQAWIDLAVTEGMRQAGVVACVERCGLLAQPGDIYCDTIVCRRRREGREALRRRAAASDESS